VNCKRLTELTTEYLENQLPRRQRLAVELHLRLCKHCQAYFDQLRQIIALLRKAPAESVSRGVLDKLLPAFRSLTR